MTGVNKVILIGRLGSDPDIRATPGGMSICNLSIATSERWTDKNTGQKQEKTEWHKVVLFNRLAEIGAQYLQKGMQVYIEGSLQTVEKVDEQGNKRRYTNIKGSKMEMLAALTSEANNNQANYQHPQQAQQKLVPLTPHPNEYSYAKNGQNPQRQITTQKLAPLTESVSAGGGLQNNQMQGVAHSIDLPQNNSYINSPNQSAEGQYQQKLVPLTESVSAGGGVNVQDDNKLVPLTSQASGGAGVGLHDFNDDIPF